MPNYKRVLSEIQQLTQKYSVQLHNRGKSIPVTERAISRAVFQLSTQQQEVIQQQRKLDALQGELKQELKALESKRDDLKTRHAESKASIKTHSQEHSELRRAAKNARQDIRESEREFRKLSRELQTLRKQATAIEPLLSAKHKEASAQQLAEMSYQHELKLREQSANLTEQRQMLGDELKINLGHQSALPNICKPRIEKIKEAMGENIQAARLLRHEILLARAKTYQYRAEKLTATIESMDAKRDFNHKHQSLQQDPLDQYQSLVNQASTIEARQRDMARNIQRAKESYKSLSKQQSEAKSRYNDAKKQCGNIGRELKTVNHDLSQKVRLQDRMERMSKKLMNIAGGIKQALSSSLDVWIAQPFKRNHPATRAVPKPGRPGDSYPQERGDHPTFKR